MVTNKKTNDSEHFCSAPAICLELTHEEGDALLCVLMNASPSAQVPEEMTERLLLCVVNAQRLATRAASAREDAETSATDAEFPQPAVSPRLPRAATQIWRSGNGVSSPAAVLASVSPALQEALV